MVKRKVTIPTVSQTAVLDAGGTRVGYLHFRNFVQPSVAALDAAFAQLRDGGRRRSWCSTCATTAAGWSPSPSTWPA